MYKKQQELIDVVVENLKADLEDVSKYDAYAMLRYCIAQLNHLKKVAEKKAIEEVIERDDIHRLKLVYHPPRDI